MPALRAPESHCRQILQRMRTDDGLCLLELSYRQSAGKQILQPVRKEIIDNRRPATDEASFGRRRSDIASRLCSLAKPGEILVGSETYRQSLGYFNFVSLDPV